MEEEINTLNSDLSDNGENQNEEERKEKIEARKKRKAQKKKELKKRKKDEAAKHKLEQEGGGSVLQEESKEESKEGENIGDMVDIVDLDVKEEINKDSGELIPSEDLEVINIEDKENMERIPENIERESENIERESSSGEIGNMSPTKSEGREENSEFTETNPPTEKETSDISPEVNIKDKEEEYIINQPIEPTTINEKETEAPLNEAHLSQEEPEINNNGEEEIILLEEGADSRETIQQDKIHQIEDTPPEDTKKILEDTEKVSEKIEKSPEETEKISEDREVAERTENIEKRGEEETGEASGGRVEEEKVYFIEDLDYRMSKTTPTPTPTPINPKRTETASPPPFTTTPPDAQSSSPQILESNTQNIKNEVDEENMDMEKETGTGTDNKEENINMNANPNANNNINPNNNMNTNNNMNINTNTEPQNQPPLDIATVEKQAKRAEELISETQTYTNKEIIPNPFQIAQVVTGQETESRFDATIGRIEEGNVLLIGTEHHVLDMPMSFLPNTLDPGSILRFTITRDTNAEQQRLHTILKLQDNLLFTMNNL